MGDKYFNRSLPPKKIKTLSEVERITQRLRKDQKTVALITGCFDIVHIGHIELFRLANKHANTVIVGLDNDETIKTSKGESRPIHNLKQRSNVLAELLSVDYVFPIEKVVNFGSKEASKTYIEITKRLQPDYLITNPLADTFWQEKEKRAKDIGIKLIKIVRKRKSATTSIIQRLESEF